MELDRKTVHWKIGVCANIIFFVATEQYVEYQFTWLERLIRTGKISSSPLVYISIYILFSVSSMLQR